MNTSIGDRIRACGCEWRKHEIIQDSCADDAPVADSERKLWEKREKERERKREKEREKNKKRESVKERERKIDKKREWEKKERKKSRES